ncbi:hypothetical protein [Mesorhizobium sp.]|nr:hypothetical protein [Mesorhizobium sp.]
MLFIDAPVQNYCWLMTSFPKVLPETKRPRGFAAAEDELPGFHPRSEKP